MQGIAAVRAAADQREDMRCLRGAQPLRDVAGQGTGGALHERLARVEHGALCGADVLGGVGADHRVGAGVLPFRDHDRRGDVPVVREREVQVAHPACSAARSVAPRSRK